jgi:hypothetical protein
MTGNPYATPASVVSDAATPRALRLYEIGRSQRTILWLVVCALAAAVMPVLRLFVGLLCILLSYPIARHVYSPPLAFVMCVLCGVPGVGALALGAIHARCARLLRGSGIRVGFIGADVSHLRAALDA